MSEKILYLFPDTNLFIQCKALVELDWSEWSGFTEVHLVVCRPVTREIDDQKTRGNSRVAQRARATYQFFGPLAEDEQDFIAIKNSAPVVKLLLEGLGQPSPELKEVLDYTKTDDQIVGCLYRFRQENPDADARLLTRDRGPLMAAKSLGLPRVPIKESWLLPPEQNEVEKENTQLRQRVSELEKSEPRFKIQLVDEESHPISELIAEHLVYDPLSNDDIDSLMDLLTRRFPEEDTDRYSNRDYPKWVRECREALSDIHEKLQIETGEPRFNFVISNEGARPGKDVLVDIVAEGNFKIYAPPYVSESERQSPQEPMLPPPPTPPKGRSRSLHNELNRSILLRAPLLLSPPSYQTDHRRDPNGFFYKPGRPTIPGNTITLECEQWRHSTGSKSFLGRISLDLAIQQTQGALTCEVHAENLTEPVAKLIPVSVTVKRVDSTERTKKLIEEIRYVSKSR